MYPSAVEWALSGTSARSSSFVDVDQLSQIQKYNLLYPPQGEEEPNRVATVLSKQSLIRQQLTKTLGLDQLGSTKRR